jgi:hypothetical protein
MFSRTARIPRISRIAAAAAVVLLASAPMSMAAASTSSPGQVGWVRLAHLSPNTPPVDVYLYSYGSSSADLVLDHVAYGDASPYESLAAGEYVVAMRAAGASPSTSPVISTDVTVQVGKAYTVAGLGPASALVLQVLNDTLGAPTGKSDVRLIEASLHTPQVTVSAGQVMLASSLKFPTVTGYTTVNPGSWQVSVADSSGTTQDQVTLAPNDSYTLAVIDGTNGPTLLALTDTASTSTVPAGGVQTGFGGTAGGHRDMLLDVSGWGALLLLGIGGAVYASRRLARR